MVKSVKGGGSEADLDGRKGRQELNKPMQGYALRCEKVFEGY